MPLRKPALIPNWRRAWRMFSVQASALTLVWLALPEEKQAAIVALAGIPPDAVPGTLVALAILGRIVAQPKVQP
jgi:hypothetical protein